MLSVYVFTYFLHVTNVGNTCISATVTRNASGPSCSKLTMSLVNDSLKFKSSDTQTCWNFLLKNMWVAFAVRKLLTFFQQKNIKILYIESAKTVHEMTLNKLVKLTTLWTTGPRCWGIHSLVQLHKEEMVSLLFLPVFEELSLRSTLKILPPKNGNFQIKNSYFFFTFLLKT